MTEQVNSGSLRMTWSRAPWDEAVCGYPVLQVTHMQVLGADAARDISAFERARDEVGAGLVSCRLPHDALSESMLLEDRGFRFIEMMYQPEIALSGATAVVQENGLSVSRATDDDMPLLLEVARSAFRNERFLMDPRIARGVSDKRYQNWVASSQHHARQELHVVRHCGQVIAFFVLEMMSDGICYWHLTALAPDAQGKGHGRRVWTTMLDCAARRGARGVRTSIAARNVRVLNLYARLGFRFLPPTMTFHWIRPDATRTPGQSVGS